MMNKEKQLKYFDVRVETMLPATLTFKLVQAETAEQAAELVKNKQPNNVLYHLNKRKDKKLTVYDASSTLIRFIKNLFGAR